MEFVQFIFSGFWTWLGLYMLVWCVCSVVLQAIKFCQKNERKIRVCWMIGNKWTIEIENATEADVATALKAYEMQPQNREGGQNGA